MLKTVAQNCQVHNLIIGSVRKNSSQAIKFPKKYFSGIQPTGAIHLGNYLGAIVQWVKLQDAGNNLTLSIVDLHSLTIPQKSLELPQKILEMTATLLACGIDPQKTVLFQQSTVPQHTELYWYLGCISTMARLGHLPQFKEKSANLKDIPLGLFTYPVLQAADILAHKATHVPVGEDQLQHLQLSQDLVRMFNSRYGNIFPIPKSLVTETARIRSLREPEKKMSKSDTDSKSCIYLTDTEDSITKKIKKAVTDFTSEVTYDPLNRLGVSNLITIHSALTGKSPEAICKEAKGLNTAKYKDVVAADVNHALAPIRRKLNEYLEDPQYLLDVLNSGKHKAIDITEKTLTEVRYSLGIRFNLGRSNAKININV
ncbi:tRNA synthetases class I (W and Y) [Popillia japonica]|uniref:Tryptophan--tRNA ligase, mitochondrial n=1 Tax=Popillia japonica TaxID=7064 RepID=A0AAW1MC37_POPJA